jgi:hypothetical protein
MRASNAWVTHTILHDITMQRLTAKPRNTALLELDARKIGKPVVVDEHGYEGNTGMTWGSFSGRRIVDMHWAITLAVAYASHGESYSGQASATGEFVGDSPAPLGFLKKIMREAPYEEMELAPDIVNSDTPNISILAKRVAYYLIMFCPPRQNAVLESWFLWSSDPVKATPGQTSRKFRRHSSSDRHIQNR